MSAQRYREIAIIGGGCYGSFYATQLATARARGKIQFETVVLVDRDPGCQAVRGGLIGPGFRLEVSDWDGFADRFFARPAPEPAAPDDALVPSPLMPHLMAHWLERLAAGRTRRVAAELSFETPFDRLAPDGTRYVSFADWLCPTHCIEPRLCPAISAPRTWEMSDAVRSYADRIAATRRVAPPALFVTRHRTFGVGMFDLAEVRAAHAVLEAALAVPEPVDVVVATVSSCHGAVTILRTEPPAR